MPEEQGYNTGLEEGSGRIERWGRDENKFLKFQFSKMESGR